MPTMGALRCCPPMEPKKGAQNENTPPSAAARRYPGWDEQLTDGGRLAGLPRVGVDHQARLVDGLEGAAWHRLELVEKRGRPTRAGVGPEVPIGTVVVQDQPVLLQGAQDHLGLGRVARDVEARLQPEPGTHRWEVRVGRRPLSGGRRPYVRGVRCRRLDPDGVRDDARLHLVVAHQPGQNGCARGVHRRQPAPEGIGVEVPDGAVGRVRSGVTGVERVVELVVGARCRVDHDGVPVAGAALYLRVGSERVRTGIVPGRAEREGNEGMPRGHQGDGHAVGRRCDRLEVGGGCVHGGEPLRAVRVDRQVRDRGVPDVVSREHRAVGRAGQGCARRRDTRRAADREAQPQHRRDHERDRRPPHPSSQEYPLSQVDGTASGEGSVATVGAGHHSTRKRRQRRTRRGRSSRQGSRVIAPVR